MKPPSVLWLLSIVVLASACSGPPNFQLPDRPASLEGNIQVVRPFDVSNGSIEIGEPRASGTSELTRHVDVSDALILRSDSAYPAVFGELSTGQFVRVWLDEMTASAAIPKAEYVEIVARPSATTSP